MANDEDDAGKMAYKVLVMFGAMTGAFIARKSLQVAWKTATGKEPPANPEHPSVTWAEAAVWAIVSGAVMGLARMLAQKKVASSWHKATGVLPEETERSTR